MPIVAVLIAQPGQRDQLLAFPAPATMGDLFDGVRRRAAGKPYRLGGLDVGDFEVGDDNPRSADELPVSDFAIHRDRATEIRLRPRRLWKVSAAGMRDRLMLTALDLEPDEVLALMRIEHAYDHGPVTIVEVQSGIFPVRQILGAYSGDGRWLDEKGYVQMDVPSLPRPAQTDAPSLTPVA